jgi:hypothetical protein
MQHNRQNPGYPRRPLSTASFCALLIPVVLLIASPRVLRAQTYQVIYTLEIGGQNPWLPAVGLSIDADGSLYGTSVRGGGKGDCPGPGGCGSVFQVAPTDSGWAETTLWGFNGPYDSENPGRFASTDGSYPYSRVILGPDGSLYGSTLSGASGGGAVYQLRRSAGGWTEVIVHRFTGGVDGGSVHGDLLLDETGRLYGTSLSGDHYGTVFRLEPSGAGWIKTTLYSFQGGNDGIWPYAGVIMDASGNLYGTTGAGGHSDCIYGGPNCGTVYQLTPSGSGYTEQIFYNFHNGNDGGSPGPLISDPSGNLYGTICGGPGEGGAIYTLSPSGSGWSFRVLSRLSGVSCGFQGSLTMDTAGSLLGVTSDGGVFERGTIFQLAPSGADWIYYDLYDFSGGSDGGEPNGSLVFDRSGNLYGTTRYGGVSHYCGGALYSGCGVVFKLSR